MTNKQIKEINPEEFYRPRELWKMNVFFWVTSYTSVHRIVAKNLDILKPKVVNYDNTRKSYLIQGKNIINLLKKRYVRDL